MKETADKNLLQKAVTGDVTAFEQLVEKHLVKLFAFAMTVTGGNRSVASDVLQEALIKAFLNIKRFKGECSFTSWLWRIVKNEFINYSKSAKTRSLISLETVAESKRGAVENVEKELILEERKKNLLKLMEYLAGDHKEIISLIDLQGMKYEEAAEFIGIKTDAARSRLFKARKKLSELVQKNKKLFYG